MELSPAGLDLIERSEDLRCTVYNDVAGIPTIGYGHRLAAGESYPGGITQAKAKAILADDVRIAESAVQRLVTVPLTQGQFDALVDFVFNLGAGRLAASTLLKNLNAGQFAAAAAQLLKWDHSGGREIAGLKARREAEFRIFTGAPAAALAAS